jgi:hypothetical protein
MSPNTIYWCATIIIAVVVVRPILATAKHEILLSSFCRRQLIEIYNYKGLLIYLFVWICFGMEKNLFSYTVMVSLV